MSNEPALDVVVEALGSSSVDMKLRVWVEDASHERPVFFLVMESAKLALDAAGIEVPNHHLQLFVEDVDERVWSRMAELQSSSEVTLPRGGWL